MSTRATASAVFPVEVNTVWTKVRDFGALPKTFEGVEKVELEGDKLAIGTTRKIVWSNGQELTQRLVEISDLHFSLSWENVSANFPTDASAAITTVRLFRITEDKTTLVQWSTEFAADVAANVISIESKNYQKNLADLRASFK